VGITLTNGKVSKQEKKSHNPEDCAEVNKQ